MYHKYQILKKLLKKEIPNKIKSLSVIMIATGFPFNAARKTEVIDLNDEEGKRCADLPDFPNGIDRASGGTINGKILICGGWNGRQEYCYTFDETQWIRSTKLKLQTYNQAEVVLNDNCLWLTGGNSGGTGGDRTEYVFSNGTTIMGPKLPKVMNGHCAVSMENGNSIFMHGENVWQYNLLTETFTSMTDMPGSMIHSGCTTYKSAKHNNRQVVFIGGGSTGNKAFILDYAITENWEESK